MASTCCRVTLLQSQLVVLPSLAWQLVFTQSTRAKLRQWAWQWILCSMRNHLLYALLKTTKNYRSSPKPRHIPERQSYWHLGWKGIDRVTSIYLDKCSAVKLDPTTKASEESLCNWRNFTIMINVTEYNRKLFLFNHILGFICQDWVIASMLNMCAYLLPNHACHDVNNVILNFGRCIKSIFWPICWSFSVCILVLEVALNCSHATAVCLWKKGVVMGEKRLPLELVACFQLWNPMVVNALSGLLLPMLNDPNKPHT